MDRKAPTLRFAALLVAAVLVLTLGFVVAPPVSAATACAEDFPANHHSGLLANYSPVYSVRGSVVDRPIILCSSSTDETSAASAWLMVHGGGNLEYAQIGFARERGMAFTRRFVEYNDGAEPGGWARSYFDGWVNGTNHFYEVLFDFVNRPRKFTLRVDGNALATTPWSPEGGVWTAGWFGEYAGEAIDRGDDIPGTVSARTNFTNVKAVIAWQGGWVLPPNPTPVISDLDFYKFGWVTQPNYFDVWTER